jgi:hypothetical protein
MDAAGMNPRTLALSVPAQFVSLSGSKKPNVKLETRSGVQILSERVGLGASYSTFPAHGRRWKGGTDPQRWTEWKGRNGNGRNADAVLAKH